MNAGRRQNIARTFALTASLSCALVAGCGSDEIDEGQAGPFGPKPEQREFPLATPSLGGYALVDAFPGITANIPSALVWPKVDGAAAFVLERTGHVQRIAGGSKDQVLDFSDAVALMSEGGALGMALHPEFGDGSGPKPYAYVWYNAKGDPKNQQRLSRFTWSAEDGSFDRESELVLLEQDEDHPEHNGGRVAFGPDGFLYFGNGDDTNPDVQQRIDNGLFAGIFRIDVDARGGDVSHPPPRQPPNGRSAEYFVPNDNPFVGTPDAHEEYFALGLRNPFGFSFDRETGALWAGDVGETWREEIDEVVAGGNYQWPHREGELAYEGSSPAIGTPRAPKYAYSHAEMADLAAILGGYIYRGKELPELAGKYVYSDWPSGRVWALDIAAAAPKPATLVDNEYRRVPMALAEDDQGEIYVLHTEGISKLVRDASRDQVPRRLSETTLFEDVAKLEPAKKLVPYEILSPLWSDAAAKRRFISVPEGKRVEVGADGALTFPAGTLLVKHFELPPSVTPRARTRRLETRVLVVGTETVYGLTYRWNPEGTDADLVLEPTDEGIEDKAGQRSAPWHFPSFGQCWSCHRAENRVLGFTSQQLARTIEGGKDQLAELVTRGVFSADAVARLSPPIARPSDDSASLEERASAYLAANCSSCHHPGASFLGGEETWNANAGVPTAERGLVGAPHHNIPMARALGLEDAPLVDPGNPEGSILLARMKSTNLDLQMPPLARNVVDAEGVAVIEQWIRSLPAGGR